MKYGLIAEKVGHSFSAEIHKELFGYDYELKAISKNELPDFLESRSFNAVNVTIPYKETVIPFLDYIDDTAKTIGAVNTVVNVDNKLYGYNTDVNGLTYLIKKNGITLENKKVLVLGSGGTSKTAIFVAEQLGASEVLRVSRNRVEGCVTYQDAVSIHNDCEVIINTTPCGMYPEIGISAVGIDCFKRLESVIDVVYNPLRTKLICDARAKGINAVGGLLMLVAQAAFAAEKFVGKTVSCERIDSVYNKIFNAKQNVVLVGMPGCGKTSTGKIIAEKLGFEFVDTDEEIHKKTGKFAHEIIEENGEKAFRDVESEVVKTVSKLQGRVISTGGGAILRKENVELLRENGKIFFLDRPLEKLELGSNRPLSSNFDDLKKRYTERYQIYLSACDKQINCVDGKELNAQMILEAL